MANSFCSLPMVVLVSVMESDLDSQKVAAAKKFIRRGMNRRQDHGSRGWNEGHIWDDRERDFTEAAKRRDFRSSERQIGQ